MIVIIGVGVACFFLLRFLKVANGNKFILIAYSAVAALSLGIMVALKIGGYFPQTYAIQETKRLRPMVVFPPGKDGNMIRLFLLEQGLVSKGDTFSYGLYKGEDKNLDANDVPVKIVEDRIGNDDDGYVMRGESRFTNKAHYLLGLPNGKTQYEFHIPPGTHKTIIG